MIEQLAWAGMDAARLNFSHGDHEMHRNSLAAVRRAQALIGRPLAVIADLQGPKIRIGRIRQPRSVNPGDMLVLAAPAAGRPGDLDVTFAGHRRCRLARARDPDQRRHGARPGRLGRRRARADAGRGRRTDLVGQGREPPRDVPADPVAHREGRGRPRVRARDRGRLRRALVRPPGRATSTTCACASPQPDRRPGSSPRSRRPRRSRTWTRSWPRATRSWSRAATRRRDRRRRRAARAEADHPHRPRRRPGRHHRDPDARVDDPPARADPGRGVRRRQCRAGRDIRADALRARRRWAAIRSRRSR